MFNKINETQMLREIAELKKQVEELKEEQIKARRDQNDQMYNLDSDNVPSLNGIVKEIRLIVQNGAVSGALIIQAINNTESEAQILASHINLSGMNINLNAGDGITITSPYFNVTKEGVISCVGAIASDMITTNMTCKNAVIEESCTLGAGLGAGGMKIGDDYTSRTSISSTRLINASADSGSSSAAIETTMYVMASDFTSYANYKTRAGTDGREAILEARSAPEDAPEDYSLVASVGAMGEGKAYLGAMGYKLWVDENGVHTNAPSIEFNAST